MKKIAFAVVLVFMGSGYMFAQTPDTLADGLMQNPKFRMGLSFSGVVSWFGTSGSPDFVDGDGTRINIAYGLHTDFGLGTNHNYYFSTGIFALNTGGTLQYTYRNPDTGIQSERTIDYRFNYINIPLTMMLRTNEVGYVVYYARVGLDNGFEFKSVYNSKDKMPDGSTVSREDEDSPNFGTLYRAGLHIEAGAEINLTGTTNLFFGLEWNNGLNNVMSKDAKGVNPDDPANLKRINANTNLIKLNVGVYF